MAAPIIGIIGGIGSGKSLVAAELVKHGGWLIAGDALGHQALCQPEIKDQVIQRWGTEVLDERGEVQRRRLGLKVFADPKELVALETLVFPWIGRRLEAEIAKARREPAVRLIVVDAAVMMEAGWDKNCDRVIFVDAPDVIRHRRILEQRGWTAREVENRERSQLPVAEKRRRADAIIDNSGTPATMAAQVNQLLREWRIVQ
jgi:dephospho-CoA kinase